MVFFTAMIIVIVLYYLQVDGLIFATIIALVAELINIFMAHTLTKSVEKRMKAHTRRLVDGYSKRLKANRKTIEDLEHIQEKSAKKLYKANMKIREYEAKLEVLEKASKQFEAAVEMKTAAIGNDPPEPETARYPSDLPSGSGRKKLPL